MLDLLNPALKGQIAFNDPTTSSSSFEQLVNMLYAMGDGNPENGWDYVEKLYANLDGKLLGTSSAVYKGVADGEYTVGLTFESAAANYISYRLSYRCCIYERECYYKNHILWL